MEAYYARRKFKHFLEDGAHVSYEVGAAVDTKALPEVTLNYYIENNFIGTNQTETETVTIKPESVSISKASEEIKQEAKEDKKVFDDVAPIEEVKETSTKLGDTEQGEKPEPEPKKEEAEPESTDDEDEGTEEEEKPAPKKKTTRRRRTAKQ